MVAMLVPYCRRPGPTPRISSRRLVPNQGAKYTAGVSSPSASEWQAGAKPARPDVIETGGPRGEEDRMPTRSARTTWTGGLQDGTGTVTLVSSGVGTYEVSFPKRAADSADGTTSPEELIAAAHTACFAMQFSALLGNAGGSGQSLDVTADVTLGPDPAGGFRISGIALTVSGSAGGVTAEEFAKIAQEAKAACPVSKALAGTEISLTVNPG
jgi:lipoyl-dependent peroxiredoxin